MGRYAAAAALAAAIVKRGLACNASCACDHATLAKVALPLALSISSQFPLVPEGLGLCNYQAGLQGSFDCFRTPSS